MLGYKLLLSHKQNGIEIQTYSAIIACMLIALSTGRKPTKRTFEMICFYFYSLASEEELMAHIEKQKNRRHNSRGAFRISSAAVYAARTFRRTPLTLPRHALNLRVSFNRGNLRHPLHSVTRDTLPSATRFAMRSPCRTILGHCFFPLDS